MLSRRLIYSDVEIRKILLSLNSSAATDCMEIRIKENPLDKNLRRQITFAYSCNFSDIWFSDRARIHVLWLLENDIESSNPWEAWATTFREADDNANFVVRAVEAGLKKSGRSTTALRNAIEFLTVIRPKAALSFISVLSKKAPLDPFVFEKRIEVNRWLRDGSGSTQDRLIFEGAISRETFPWSQNDYVVLERVSFGKLPKSLQRWALKVISTLRGEKTFWSVSPLKIAIESSLKINDQAKTRSWTIELFKALVADKQFDPSASMEASVLVARLLVEFENEAQFNEIYPNLLKTQIFSVYQIGEQHGVLLKYLVNRKKTREARELFSQWVKNIALTEQMEAHLKQVISPEVLSALKL